MAIYKNWPEICKIGDPHIMAAIAWVDPISTMATKLKQAFPECFSEHEVRGPVPLSILREYADREALDQEGQPAHDMLQSYGALEHFDVPFIEFSTDPKDYIGTSPPPLLPAEINKNTPVGAIIHWQRKPYVVVENNQNSGVNLMVLAPVDCVDVVH